MAYIVNPCPCACPKGSSSSSSSGIARCTAEDRQLLPLNFELVAPAVSDFFFDCCEDFGGVFILTADDEHTCNIWRSGAPEKLDITCDDVPDSHRWILTLSTGWELTANYTDFEGSKTAAGYEAPIELDGQGRIKPVSTLTLDFASTACDGWPGSLTVEPV